MWPKRGEKKGAPKKTSNSLMKHHQNESSPQRPHPCSHRFYWILQKAAVCRIDELRQVECLISPVIITALLIDTGLSPTAASPGETFDPCSLSPGGASVYLPSSSPGRKTNTQDRFWARVCWGVFFFPHIARLLLARTVYSVQLTDVLPGTLRRFNAF